jgi:glycerate kinase
MRIVVAPDKFKGCLSATEVAAAMAAGARAVEPNILIDECPMADGGEGTVDALVKATGGRFVMRRVTGPLPEMQVDATFGLIDEGRTAVIEMAAASGLHLLRPDAYDALRATTFGTGELLRAAVEIGVRKIILGIGGSATTDGGVGCRDACARVLDKLRGIEIVVACDVSNPLYGPNGAAHIFGPQKGASPEQVSQLDERLRKLADHFNAHDLAKRPGAGAAGGLGFGMMLFFAASLRPGIDIVIEATRLPDRLRGADLCFTGEGRFDHQTASGKVVTGVARESKRLRVPCVAIVGSIAEDSNDVAREIGLSRIVPLVRGGVTVEQAIREAQRLIAQGAACVVSSGTA